MSSFHIGDNIHLVGSHNVGKFVDRPDSVGEPRSTTERSGLVWRDPLVFVNFRHTDEKAAADVDAELTRRLGSGAVFRDVRMPAGTAFPGELVDKASSCRVMIAIIGERWDDDHGLSLLGDRHDWVRREIATALAHRVQVVPVLVGARARLVANDLPDDIRSIAQLQAPQLRRGYDELDVRRLVDGLLRDLPGLPDLAAGR